MWSAMSSSSSSWRSVSTNLGTSWAPEEFILHAPDWVSNASPNFAEPAIYVPPGKEGEQMILTFDKDNSGRSTYMGITLDGGVTWQYMIANKSDGTFGNGDRSRFDSYMLAHGGSFYFYYAGSDTPTPTLNGNIQIGHRRIIWDPTTLVRT